MGLDVFCLIGLYESLLNVLPHAKDFCGIEVAQLDWKFNTAGDDVDCSGSLSLVTIQNEPRTMRTQQRATLKDMARCQVHRCRSRLRSRTV